MKRGSKCIARTINLSNPETCVRPRMIRKLVDAEATQPCPSIGSDGSSYWTPRPVAIKICTWRDVRRTCPPKLCDCRQKAKPKTFGQQFCGALLFLLKSGIAAGLVYWTHSEGLWGSSAEVEDLYYRILTTISPALRNEYSGNDVVLPRMDEFGRSAIQRYNRAVYAITSCIVGASTKLKRRIGEMLSSREESTSDRDGPEGEDRG